MNQEQLTNLFDYQQKAQEVLAAHGVPGSLEYIEGGSGDELTLRNNRLAFDTVRLLPRVLGVHALPDTQTRVDGFNLTFPLLLAPVAYQKLAHESGESGSLNAAMAQEVGYCLSTQSSSSIEDVGSLAHQVGKTAPLLFQLYVQADDAVNIDLIKRAELAGFDGIMITLDAPVNGIRNREARANFSLPPNISAVNLSNYPTIEAQDLAYLLANAPDWGSIQKLIELCKLPVYLKGILHPNDALQAQASGAQGIVVSNHGGRVLDGVPASVDMLPQIRTAVGDNFTILLDSGIRRGSDIFKALALGADACMVGRPIMHALAVSGPYGVAHCIKILKDELCVTMALMGCSSIDEITGDCLITA